MCLPAAYAAFCLVEYAAPLQRRLSDMRPCDAGEPYCASDGTIDTFEATSKQQASLDLTGKPQMWCASASCSKFARRDLAVLQLFRLTSHESAFAS